MSAYPPVTFPPPPPTSNTLSSQQRSAFLRSARKISKVLGDVPRVLDDDMPQSSTAPSGQELARTLTATSTSTVQSESESTWRKRKPTHLPPLLKLSGAPGDAPDSPYSLASPVYNLSPAPRRGSVLSIAPSIVSNAPSTASGSSVSSNAPTEASYRRAKLERLRRKLGDDVPATAVFPATPRTAVPPPRTPRTAKPPSPRSRTRTRSHSRSRPAARLPSQTDDARSVAFSISSDESVHTVTFTAAHVQAHAPRAKSKHVYQTGPLPPVPRVPAHLASGRPSSSSRAARGGDQDGDDAGLVRQRQKMAAGSLIGGSEFKAARRAKREGRAATGMAEPGELVEMVGFLRF